LAEEVLDAAILLVQISRQPTQFDQDGFVPFPTLVRQEFARWG